MTEAKKYIHPIDPESVFPALVAASGSCEAVVCPVAYGQDGDLYLQTRKTFSSVVEIAKREIANERNELGLGEKDIVLGVLVSTRGDLRNARIRYEKTGIGVWVRPDQDASIIPLGQSRIRRNR